MSKSNQKRPHRGHNITEWNARAKAVIARVPVLEKQIADETTHAKLLQTRLSTAYSEVQRITKYADNMDASNRLLANRIKSLETQLAEKNKGWFARLMDW